MTTKKNTENAGDLYEGTDSDGNVFYTASKQTYRDNHVEQEEDKADGESKDKPVSRGTTKADQKRES
ncbi:hypothetical protein [Corynebacterium renale]|uniref:Uncharacterized protein n=1 Tax=Corynebacterium renale TaxID=1724 RepID=A0A2A9DNB4_9CORY|nr:hypothetical protein [Corynebacterium renale]PFG27400.1 hypothetical protein ATK06_0456 [Corynebacterium renale]SQI23513.1 Uncharacterised protein [Corynebacterium renale]